MSHLEKHLINRILQTLDPETERLVRINAGTGWTGRVVQQREGILVLERPRPLKAAPAGWPDLTGWRSVMVGPEHVGQVLAVFRGVEVKTGRQQLSDAQKRFKVLLERMGGIYEVRRDES